MILFPNVKKAKIGSDHIENIPFNTELIEKIYRDNVVVIKGISVPSIKFTGINVDWVFESEEDRDAQYDEIEYKLNDKFQDIEILMAKKWISAYLKRIRINQD